MTQYKDLLKNDDLLFLSENANGFLTGYHIFFKYLIAHLGHKNVTTIVQRDGPDDMWSRVYPQTTSFGYHWPDFPDTPTDVLINFPLLLDMDFVANAAPLVNHCISLGGHVVVVLHDITFSRPHFKEASTRFGFFGAYEASAYGLQNAALKKLLKELPIESVTVVAPSQFMYEEYFGIHENLVVIPHPTQEYLSQFVHAVKEPVIVTSSQYKSNLSLLWGVVSQVLEHPQLSHVKFVVPNFWGAAATDHIEMVSQGRVDFPPYAGHLNTLASLNRATMYCDFSQFEESFGFMAHEALYFGAKVAHRGKGAFRDLHTIDPVNTTQCTSTTDYMATILKTFGEPNA